MHVTHSMTKEAKRSFREEKKKLEVKKLGPCKTYMTLLKGFVCCAVLTLPRSFINGGWLFQLATLTIAAVLTTYCAILLLEIREKLKASSYTAIGEITLGKWGKVFVNISLLGS